MRFIADFHIHSHYSIATSKDLEPGHLDYWARQKGISVIGTGDFTHPGWLSELEQKLQPSGEGLYELRPEFRLDSPVGADREVRFMLTAEISSIYKKDGRVRKVHNVIFAPDFETVRNIQNKLSRIGNITSDGRPILGLDSRDVLEIALEANPDIFFLPAHIWTPWFSALGSKSGFDSIAGCYRDLATHISAVETGLSTDPPMNWMCSFLDKYTLLSNSDAHSPQKLGRNANVFNTELGYSEIISAIRTADPHRFLGTIDLFPQEGKYHYDGHRNCSVCWDPVQTLQNKGLCSKCGKKVTVGVMNRIVQLSDREDLSERPRRMPYHLIIPLKEILSEIHGSGPASKKVTQAYQALIRKAGSEFNVLLNLPLSDLETMANEVLVEAIRRMRNNEVIVREGYDGRYGEIRVFNSQEEISQSAQNGLFGGLVREEPATYKVRDVLNFSLPEFRRLQRKKQAEENSQTLLPAQQTRASGSAIDSLDSWQQKAAEHYRGPALVLAGPGTGKTRILIHRIARLIRQYHVPAEHILALTFTNHAADELKTRLKELLGREHIKVQTSTLHALGYEILSKYAADLNTPDSFLLIDETERRELLCTHLGVEKNKSQIISRQITAIKQQVTNSADIEDAVLKSVFESYTTLLKKMDALDLDDLIYRTVLLLNENPGHLRQLRNRFQWILVDEYQDVNQAQYHLLKLLASGNMDNLFVIGDPNQAIYGFRGADVSFINRFTEDYPQSVVYRLKKSYRCSSSILRASGDILLDAHPAMLQGVDKGVKIDISEHPTDKSEAEFVARTIEQMMGGLRFFSMDSAISEGRQAPHIESLSDFAVLVRTGHLMPALQKAFLDHSIPFQAIRGNTWFEKEPGRSALFILKALAHTNDAYTQRIIGDDYEKAALLNRLRKRVHAKTSVREMLLITLDTLTNQENKDMQRGTRPVLNWAEHFGSRLSEFVRAASLGGPVDSYDQRAERVPLMTIHAAKGLEFKCVFILACEDDLLPYRLYRNDSVNMDEERRLLYVGMTRASHYLFLTHSRKRQIMGRTLQQERSRFLDHIERELIKNSIKTIPGKPKKDQNQLRLF